MVVRFLLLLNQVRFELHFAEKKVPSPFLPCANTFVVFNTRILFIIRRLSLDLAYSPLQSVFEVGPLLVKFPPLQEADQTYFSVIYQAPFCLSVVKLQPLFHNSADIPTIISDIHNVIKGSMTLKLNITLPPSNITGHHSSSKHHNIA